MLKEDDNIYLPFSSQTESLVDGKLKTTTMTLAPIEEEEEDLIDKGWEMVRTANRLIERLEKA